MTPYEILQEKERCFKQIAEAEESLTKIRKLCKHEQTYIGKYSWRPGAIHDAEICTYCGALINYVLPVFTP